MNSTLLAILLLIRLYPFGGAFIEKGENYYADKYLQPQAAVKVIETKYSKPPKKTDESKIQLNSNAVYTIDLKTNTVLDEKNSRERLPIASLTKLMTAYITLKELPLDKVIEINTNYLRTGDATAGLLSGEDVTVLTALQATLINSASEGATSLAIAHSGSVDAFVAKMNQTARELELNNTNFGNPVGWDEQNNYSSAEDITNLSRILLRNKTFLEIVNKKELQVKTTNGRVVQLSNTNQLLGENGFSGVKTGFTYVAGECLVSLHTQGERDVLTTVIGSNDRFGETREIINWISNHFLW